MTKTLPPLIELTKAAVPIRQAYLLLMAARWARSLVMKRIGLGAFGNRQRTHSGMYSDRLASDP